MTKSRNWSGLCFVLLFLSYSIHISWASEEAQGGTFGAHIYSEAIAGDWTPYIPGFGDFNGDGRTDVLMYHHIGPYWQTFVRLADPSNPGIFGPAIFSYAQSVDWSPYSAGFGDFNGDGSTDVLMYHWAGSRWQTIVRLADPTNPGSFGAHIYSEAIAGNWTPYIPGFGDFNGDGRTDVLMYHHTGPYWQTFVRLADSSNPGTFGPAIYSYAQSVDWSPYSAGFGDFNGDGSTDVLMYDRIGTRWQTIVRLADPLTPGSFGPAIYSDTINNSDQWSTYNPGFGDFDGDGRTDVLLYRRNASVLQLWVRLSLANDPGKFGEHIFTGAIHENWSPYSINFGDFNADGKTDVLLYYHTGPDWQTYVCLSRGDGTFAQPKYSNSVATDWSSYSPAQGDFDGDGMTDVLMYHHAGSRWQTLSRLAEEPVLQIPSIRPILIIKDKGYLTNPFGNYLAEILRSEGLVEFEEIELSQLLLEPDPLVFLNNYDTIILAECSLDSITESLIRSYVSGGGNLIAMRPDHDLSDMFGLSYIGHRPEQLIQFFDFDTQSEAGNGIVNEPLQYHGPADEYMLNGATSLGTLFNDENTPSIYPAVTINQYGSGRAAAFVFDLAKNIVLLRQGNPDWANYGSGTRRPWDLFINGSNSWYLKGKLEIPQADEQQRFLSNLIYTFAEKPLPRLWYFPNAEKTVIVVTGDAETDIWPSDIGNQMSDLFNGYDGVMTAYLHDGEAPRQLESMIDRVTLNDVNSWLANGHEVSVHPWNQSCTFDEGVLRYTSIFNQFVQKYGFMPRTVRNHWVAWVGWSEQAELEEQFGIKLDTNYYHMGTPVELENGYYTGSGLPQRFCDEKGRLIDVYQLLTEWADDMFRVAEYTSKRAMQEVCSKAIEASENGYYSAFIANVHQSAYKSSPTPFFTSDWANALWTYAYNHGIPLISSEKLLDFIEARNGAQFNNIAWNGATLSFEFTAPFPGQNLTIMIPAEFSQSVLTTITVNGSPYGYTIEEIKGRDYAMFTLTDGTADIVAQFN